MQLNEFDRLHGVADQVVAHRQAKGLNAINPNLERYMKAPDDAHHIIPPSEIISRVIDRARKGITGARLPWEKSHERIRFAPGQLTVWAGAVSSFKSSLLSQSTIGFAEQHFKTCVTSLEEPIEEYGLRLVRQMNAESKPSSDKIQAALEGLHGYLWFWDVRGIMTAQRALAMMRYCASELQIEHFVFDNVTCVVNPSNEAAAEQWEFVRQAHRLARDTGMHIHLVMHTRKGVHDGKDKAPSIDDVRGSSTIVQQADQVIVVWRNIAKEDAIAEAGSSFVKGEDMSIQPDVTLLIEKAKFTGWRGRIGLWSNHKAWQFIESGIDEPRVSPLVWIP